MPTVILAQDTFPMPDSFIVFQHEQLKIAYPNNWKANSLASNVLDFRAYLPKRNNGIFNSPAVIVQNFAASKSNANFALGLEQLSAFKYPFETITHAQINGLPAICVQSSGNNPSERYHIYLGGNNRVTLSFSGVKEDMEYYRPILDSIKNSLVIFKDKFPIKKTEVLEVFNQEELKSWRILNEPYGGGSTKISKLDKILMGFNRGTKALKIVEENRIIEDWNAFFDWKQQSIFRDSTVFKYPYTSFEILDIFSNQVQLSAYDSLLITEFKPFHLQFDFIKQTGEQIRLIIQYETAHPFPLNQKMPMSQFAFRRTDGFTRRNGKSGHIMEFQINHQGYDLRLERMEIY